GEKSAKVPNPSCNAAHRESQPSPVQNMYTGAAGECKVEPDAAPTVLPAVVVLLLLLPELPVTPSLLSEKMYDLKVAPRGLSHQCPP
ncbi:hypothetical protein A2U01_0069747, partial [Trifolium medium]|nr:hypothetical protein [Trifolium medium]